MHFPFLSLDIYILPEHELSLHSIFVSRRVLPEQLRPPCLANILGVRYCINFPPPHSKEQFAYFQGFHSQWTTKIKTYSFKQDAYLYISTEGHSNSVISCININKQLRFAIVNYKALPSLHEISNEFNLMIALFVSIRSLDPSKKLNVVVLLSSSGYAVAIFELLTYTTTACWLPHFPNVSVAVPDPVKIAETTPSPFPVLMPYQVSSSHCTNLPLWWVGFDSRLTNIHPFCSMTVLDSKFLSLLSVHCPMYGIYK